MRISVVIPTHNRCRTLKTALDSLLDQEETGGIEYEVVVVDNNSTDRTRELVEEYQAKTNGKVRYVRENQKGVTHARNRGVTEARGELLAFTDDDAWADRRWIVNIHRLFERYHPDAAGGRVLAEYPEGTPQWIKDNRELLRGPVIWYDLDETTRPYVSRYMAPFIAANLVIRRQAFEECGLFDGPGPGTTSEDTEIFHRLINQGKTIYYAPELLVHHPADRRRMSWVYLAKWFIRYGRFLTQVDKRKSSGVPRKCFMGIPVTLIQQALVKNGMTFFTRVGMILEYIRGPAK